MVLQEQIVKLIDKLVELTGENRVDWSETADENTYLASVAKFTVTIGIEHPASANPDYRLQIADWSGKVIEDVTVDGSGPVPTLGTYGLLKNLFEIARRRAMHVDQAVSEMLSSLEQIR